MVPSPSDLRAFSLVACLVLVGRTALELLIPRSQGALLDLAYHLGHMFDVSLAAVLFGRALASASRVALVGDFVVIGVIVVRDLGHVVALPAAQHLEALRGVGFALGSAALLWELGRTARHARAALVMGALGALAMTLGAVLGAVAPPRWAS